VIEARPRALVDQEVVQARLPERRAIARQLDEQGRIAGPDLLEEQPVHQAGRLDHLRKRRCLIRGQRADVRADLDGREAGDHLLELRFRGHGGWRGHGLGGLLRLSRVPADKSC
jgi:hypothetical protein